MTRKEALKVLIETKEILHLDTMPNRRVDEALSVAIEALEAEPIKHGKWVKDNGPYSLYKCSACNEFCTVAGWANCIPEERMYKAFKYCPNCGARMQSTMGQVKQQNAVNETDEVENNTETLEAWNLDGSPTRYIKGKRMDEVEE